VLVVSIDQVQLFVVGLDILHRKVTNVKRGVALEGFTGQPPKPPNRPTKKIDSLLFY
jgi:hypothetical protein